jgi:hypothetical protein
VMAKKMLEIVCNTRSDPPEFENVVFRYAVIVAVCMDVHLSSG